MRRRKVAPNDTFSSKPRKPKNKLDENKKRNIELYIAASPGKPEPMHGCIPCKTSHEGRKQCKPRQASRLADWMAGWLTGWWPGLAGWLVGWWPGLGILADWFGLIGLIGWIGCIGWIGWIGWAGWLAGKGN